METEEASAAEVQKQVADAETRKLALEAQTAGLKEHKAALEESLSALQAMLTKVRDENSNNKIPDRLQINGFPVGGVPCACLAHRAW